MPVCGANALCLLKLLQLPIATDVSCVAQVRRQSGIWGLATGQCRRPHTMPGLALRRSTRFWLAWTADTGRMLLDESRERAYASTCLWMIMRAWHLLREGTFCKRLEFATGLPCACRSRYSTVPCAPAKVPASMANPTVSSNQGGQPIWRPSTVGLE